MTSWTRESIALFEHDRRERMMRVRAFCDEHGITVDEFCEARARAVAKMREPRADRWTVVFVEAPTPRHHLTVVQPTTPTLEAFLARYTDEQIEAMLVEIFGERWRAR